MTRSSVAEIVAHDTTYVPLAFYCNIHGDPSHLKLLEPSKICISCPSSMTLKLFWHARPSFALCFLLRKSTAFCLENFRSTGRHSTSTLAWLQVIWKTHTNLSFLFFLLWLSLRCVWAHTAVWGLPSDWRSWKVHRNAWENRALLYAQETVRRCSSRTDGWYLKMPTIEGLLIVK